MTTSAFKNHGPNPERGSALIVTVAAIAAMLLFASIIVDVGFVMLERRQDQSAADTAALAAVGDRYSEVALAATVLEVLNLNIPGANFTDADLRSSGLCPAETLEAGWSYYPNYPCLAHSGHWDEIRVRVPVQEYNTALGQLAGINTIEHTAFAQAGSYRQAAVLPFAIDSSANGFECLKVGTSSAAQCTGNTYGNFGNIEFDWFGSPPELFNTTLQCNSPSAIYVANLAQGIDHGIAVWDGVSANQLTDTAGCNQVASSTGSFPVPNAAETMSGNTPGNLGAGIWDNYTAPDGGPSRLRRTSSLSTFVNHTIGSVTVDDTPLWNFIDPTLNNVDNVPRSCYADQFTGNFNENLPYDATSNNMDTGAIDWPDDDMLYTSLPVAVRTYFGPASTINRPDRMVMLLERCFDHYEGNNWVAPATVDTFGNPVASFGEAPSGCTGPCSDPVFTVDSDPDDEIFDIEDSPRFAYVPSLWGTDSTGDPVVRFGGFRAVYIQRVLRHSDIFDPGLHALPGLSVPGGVRPANLYSGNFKQAAAMGALVFPEGILPNGLADSDAAVSLGRNQSVELTR